ncbi:transglycosylase domain-containing protein [Allocoprobacillus halotolerans]|uniref:Transglycosylase domain-containing protein n=1 Tax=Allocoprobacillus halotolerans TaxID=2944914 RepID=A0ABY5I4K4_9FIRM|nr:hypothetical protein [Allocoprobacillus halotolerans]UTY38983.1 transglycosylase domain-containing protein [Allocoprobacillus halotolerans]
MKKISKKKSTKTGNQRQKRRIIKVICLILAVLITSGGMYLGFGIFKQVEGFSKERLVSDESSILCTTDGEEWFSVARGGVQKNVTYNDIPQVMIDAVVAAEDSRFLNITVLMLHVLLKHCLETLLLEESLQVDQPLLNS